VGIKRISLLVFFSSATTCPYSFRGPPPLLIVAQRAQLRWLPGVPGGALNLNSTGHPDHGRYGDLPLQGKIPTAEPGIETGTSWIVVGSSDHQATRMVSCNSCK
jgi:hypothetical protein